MDKYYNSSMTVDDDSFSSLGAKKRYHDVKEKDSQMHFHRNDHFQWIQWISLLQRDSCEKFSFNICAWDPVVFQQGKQRLLGLSANAAS